MSDPVRAGLGPRALVAAAASAYLVAVALTMAAWYAFALDRGAAAMERFGRQAANDLAFIVVEPMLRLDRIRLGLLAKRLAERVEVRSVEMVAVDGEPLVVEGNPRAADPVFASEVAIEDTVAGRVRVALRGEAFQPEVAALLLRSWGILAVGLALCMSGAYAYSRFDRRPRRSQLPAGNGVEPEPTPEPARVFVVVATVFPRRSAAGDPGALGAATAFAQRVANLYAGEARAFADAGVALNFQAGTSDDRAFEVVCAALLLQRLLVGPPDAETDADTADDPSRRDASGSVGPRFRLGLDLVDVDRLAADAPPEEIAVLASLAPDGELVLGQAAYRSLADAERVRIRAFDNPAFQALSGDAVPEGIVVGTTTSDAELIARQADVVATDPAI